MRQYTKTYRITISEIQAKKLIELKEKYNVAPTKVIRKAIDRVLSDFTIKTPKNNIKTPFKLRI